jgi:hypothetical protein
VGFAHQRNGGLMLPTDTFTRLRAKFIADLALRLRLPTISADDEAFARAGVLMYYGVTDASVVNQFRQAATYVDRILKGTKPAELPIQSPDRYTLIINLKTAKALGLNIPETLLATADEVMGVHPSPGRARPNRRWSHRLSYVRDRSKFRCYASKRGGSSDPNVWSGRAVQEVSSILATRSCINVSGL